MTFSREAACTHFHKSPTSLSTTVVLVCKIHISLTSHHTPHTDMHPSADANPNLTRLYVPSCHFSLVNIVAPRPSNMFSAKGVLCVHQLGLPPIIQTKPLQDYCFTHFWGDFQIKCLQRRLRENKHISP